MLYFRLFLLSAALLMVSFLGNSSAKALNLTAEPATLDLVNYQPEPSHFQKQLRPIVKLFVNEKYPEAIKTSQKFLSTLPRGYHDEIYLLLGLAYKKLNNFTDALAAFEDSINRRGDNYLALFNHAYLLKQEGDCARAVTEFQEVSWRLRTNHQAYFYQGECLLELGKKEQAVITFQKAAQYATSSSHYIPLYKRLIVLQKELLEEAKEPADKLIHEQAIFSYLHIITTEDPNDKEAALERATLLLKYTDPLLTANYITEAEKLILPFVKKSKYKDTEAVKMLFEIKLKKQDFEAATEVLNKGLAATPNSPELLTARKQLELEQGLKIKEEEKTEE